MVGAANMLGGSNFAQALVRTSDLAGKPQFELQFNILQNTIIDRLNEKIEDAIAEDDLQNGKIDIFLLESAKKLTTVQQGIEQFTFENAHNIRAMVPILEHLENLGSKLSANDTDGFNKELARLNNTTGKLKITNGVTVGIFSDDGIQKLRNAGVLRYDDSGTAKRATSLSDFADNAAASAAIDAAKNEIANVSTSLVYKQEGAEVVKQGTANSLNSTLLQIEAARVADQGKKAEEITKLREEYGHLLNALSLAFESSQVLTNKLGSALFEAPRLDTGSVLNLFT